MSCIATTTAGTTCRSHHDDADARGRCGRCGEVIDAAAARAAAVTPQTVRQAEARGWVTVGEWGWGRGPAHLVWCQPEDREAVRAELDALGDYDLSPGVLDGVRAAGGVLLPEYDDE